MKIIQLTHKVLLLCCAIVILIGNQLYAQDIQGGGSPLSYGVRAGFSAPILTINKQPIANYRLAPIIGGYAQYRVLPWVAASLEVVYTQYGGSSISPLLIYSPESPMLNNNLGKTDLNIHSIEIPISAKIGLPGMSGSIKPFVSLGVSAAFFTMAKSNYYILEDNGTDLPYLIYANDVVTTSIKNHDFSCISGTGVDFQGDKFNFSIEIYYRIGLTNLNANTKTYVPDYRANAFGVKIGIGL